MSIHFDRESLRVKQVDPKLTLRTQINRQPQALDFALQACQNFSDRVTKAFGFDPKNPPTWKSMFGSNINNPNLR